MQLSPVTTKEAASALRNCPLVAVDLGFSNTAKSCGVAHYSEGGTLHTEELTFADAVAAVAGSVRSSRECVLILEAPLSAAFDEKGNPCPRHDIERSDPPRWWSIGAGAAMALAALHFCRRLHDRSPADVRLNLVEGFVTGDESKDHSTVAGRLVKAFLGEHPAQWFPVACEGQIVSITEWFRAPSGTDCPVILKPKRA